MNSKTIDENSVSVLDQHDNETSQGRTDGTAIVDVSVVTTPPTPKMEIGPYALRHEIGRGAMGAVYEAVHRNLKRKVALKLLPANLTALPGRLARFQREMEAVGRLDHPNIVRATDAGEVAGVHYLAMDLVQGVDLAKVLEAHGPLSPPVACEVTRQAALGLQHIHEHGLVHRDIKPSNLMLAGDGQIKILDLGIALLHQSDDSSSLTATNTLIGTPDFMAPEQVSQTKDIDIRVDVYSLGCTLYTLLAGKPLFDGPGYETHVEKLIAHGTQAPRELTAVAPDVPSELSRVVTRMIEKNPADRWQTPQQVADALAPWCDSEGLKSLAKVMVDQRINSARETIGHGPDVTRLTPVAPAVPDKTRRLYYLVAAIAATAALVLAASLGLRNSATRDNDGGDANSNTAEFAPGPERQDGEMAAPLDHPLAKPLNDIAKNTKSIDQTTRRMAATTESMNTTAERMAESLEALRGATQALSSSGGLVTEPQSPGELYHNARTYELLGNYAAARECYQRFFAFGLGLVDVHHRFQKSLKLQAGPAGAREVYRDLLPELDPIVGQYAVSLLQEPAEQEKALESLVQQEPNFAPAVYELSRCRSVARLGRQTLADKSREKDLLQRFLSLHEQGYVLRYFLEKNEAATIIQDARTRLAALDVIEDAALQNPVTMICSRHNSGWSLTIRIGEPALEIFYRTDSAAQFRSTGHQHLTNPSTGKPFPITQISLPRDTGTCRIEIKYRDARGHVQGPYALPFDPVAETARDGKRILQMTQHAWLMFAGSSGNVRLHFGHLIVYRDAIETVRYGLNQEQPQLVLQLPAKIDGSQRTWLPVPDKTRFAVAQLVFRDGTVSDVIRFER